MWISTSYFGEEGMPNKRTAECGLLPGVLGYIKERPGELKWMGGKDQYCSIKELIKGSSTCSVFCSLLWLSVDSEVEYWEAVTFTRSVFMVLSYNEWWREVYGVYSMRSDYSCYLRCQEVKD